MNKKLLRTLLAMLLLLSLGACDLASGGQDSLRASGTIAAREVAVSPELGGQVMQVFVDEGDSVQAGDPLFQLDDKVLRAQYDQAVAAVAVAEATVDATQAQLESARLQYQLTLQAARLQDQPSRVGAWKAAPPAEFALPTWYFEQDEVISATTSEVTAAQAALDVELSNLETVLRDASNADLVAAERRLAAAQATFLVAQQTLDQASGVDSVQKAAQEQLDAAKSALDAAQSAYNRLLTTAAAADVLEARARATVAQARYDNAVDRLSLLLSGSHSRQVEAALAGVHQAEAAAKQAQANQAQAEAARHVLEVQLAKAAVHAPIAGVVLARHLEVGELATPGSTALMIGQLDEVKLIVYIGEAYYGRVRLEQPVQLSVDAFPGETFAGSVVHISDEAEFTPRNVQTVDGRKSTVYAVEIRVPNKDGKLKPGMPADVLFER